jgi:SAM-dependent methyltransferase
VTLNDPDVVRNEYENEHGLAGRKAAYAYADGPNARDIALAALAQVAPRRVLDVGCGEGDIAERIVAEVGAEVVAVDQSERMVELTRARGVEARVADAQELPFEDESFDAVLAAWMLYHVPDVDRALAEFARVLEPGGRLVAVTNSHEHLAELHQLLNIRRASYPFSSEDGEEQLRRHFPRVDRVDAYGWVDFPDREALQRYVDASATLFIGGQVPPIEGPFRVRRAPTIFVADKAAA